MKSHTITAAALILALPATAQTFDARATVFAFWQGKGVPDHVAEGIADQTLKESGGDPLRTGDGGTSLGLYQHHGDRMKTLLAAIENDQAFREVLGDDPVASQHWDEIRAAPDRKAAARLWQMYFERPAGTPRATPPPAVKYEFSLPMLSPPTATSTNPFVEPAQPVPEMVFSQGGVKR